MKSIARITLLSSTALILFIGCSGNGSQTAAPTGALFLQSHAVQRTTPSRSAAISALGRPAGFRLPVANVGSASPAEKSPAGCLSRRVYVADYNTNSIQIYPEGVTNPRPCGTITNGISQPLGLYVDTSGTLYVANSNTNSVTEYQKDQIAPSVTLTTGLNQPVDVFVGRDGTLYVAEFTANSVVEFDRGATSPSRTITGLDGAEGVATNNDNDLFVSYAFKPDQGRVLRFKPKATTGTDRGVSVSFAGDEKLTKSNALVFADQNNQVINIYPQGQTSPSRTIPTPNNYPYHFALNKAETKLYSAAFTAQVIIYDFQTAAQIATISSGLTSASGVALDPSAPY